MSSHVFPCLPMSSLPPVFYFSWQIFVPVQSSSHVLFSLWFLQRHHVRIMCDSELSWTVSSLEPRVCVWRQWCGPQARTFKCLGIYRVFKSLWESFASIWYMVSHNLAIFVLAVDFALANCFHGLGKIGHNLLRTSSHFSHLFTRFPWIRPARVAKGWHGDLCTTSVHTHGDSQTHKLCTDITWYHRLFGDSIRFLQVSQVDGRALVLQTLKTQQTQQLVPAEKSAHICCAPRTLCSTSGAKMWNMRSQRNGRDLICSVFVLLCTVRVTFGLCLCPWTFLSCSPGQMHRSILSLTFFLFVVLVFGEIADRNDMKWEKKNKNNEKKQEKSWEIKFPRNNVCNRSCQNFSDGHGDFGDFGRTSSHGCLNCARVARRQGRSSRLGVGRAEHITCH